MEIAQAPVTRVATLPWPERFFVLLTDEIRCFFFHKASPKRVIGLVFGMVVHFCAI